MASIVAHEAMEVSTDPLINAWCAAFISFTTFAAIFGALCQFRWCLHLLTVMHNQIVVALADQGKKSAQDADNFSPVVWAFEGHYATANKADNL